MKRKFIFVVLISLIFALHLCSCSPVPVVEPPPSNMIAAPPWPYETAPPENNLPRPASPQSELIDDGSGRYSSSIPENAYIYPDGEGPVEITLKEGSLRPTGAAFIARNTGTTTPGYSPGSSELQVKINGRWENLISYSGGGGLDVALSLKPDEEAELPFDWTVRYGELSPGTYRFITVFNYLTKGDLYSSCTFEIEAQDRTDEKFKGYPWPIGLEDERRMSDAIPISLSVVSKALTPSYAEFIFKNETDTELHYGLTFSVQIRIEDRWYRIEWRKVGDKINEPPPGWEVPIPVPPNSSITLFLDWEQTYGELPAGTYRVARRAWLSGRGTFDGGFSNLYSEPFTIE